MKLSVFALTLLATVSLRAADPAPGAVAAKPKLPEPAVEKLNELLPKFTPAPEVKPLTTFAPVPTIREQSVARAPASQQEASDPEVVELPKMTVKQQPRPRVRLGESTILGPKAFNDELVKKNFTALDQGLNKFTLPLFGTPAAERARDDYNLAQKQQFMSDVMTISKAVEQTDPAAAQALRDAAAKP
jgi:hypothetical protein